MAQKSTNRFLRRGVIIEPLRYDKFLIRGDFGV